jgi:hypothetical protein
MSTREKLINARLGMLALAEELQNISLVCRPARFSEPPQSQLAPTWGGKAREPVQERAQARNY